VKKLCFGLMVALASAAAVLAASADSAASGLVGHVDVNDNTSGENTIGAFDRHADGTLTPMAGSPFAAGGVGIGNETVSQGALQLSSDGRCLLTVDARSNQISVLRIKPDGSLEAVVGGPVSSNGVDPVSIAVHGDLVYVANAGTTRALLPAPAKPTTPASHSTRAASCGRSPARPSRSRTRRSRATCSSAPTAASSSVPAWRLR